MTALPLSFSPEVAAARAAGAHGFIMSKPDGYATMVGERGAMLSGGQAQRIAIARALVCKPRVLILDEATSALDSGTEAAVQDAIRAGRHDRTTLVVAHRLSTIADADCIMVLEEGRVTEQGTHEQLLELGGKYAAMWARQSADEAEISKSPPLQFPGALPDGDVTDLPKGNEWRYAHKS